MNSIPRLSGQNSDFDGTLLQHIFFVTTKKAIIDANFKQLASESKNSHLDNASCLVEYRNCLISYLSSRFFFNDKREMRSVSRVKSHAA